MTTTSNTELEGLLSARKAELTGPPAQLEVIDAEVVDMTTGEVVPAAAVEQSPIAPAAPAPSPEPVVHYPEVPPKVVGGLPYIREYVKLARTISMTEMVPAAFKGRYDAITAAFMRGYELGLGPMQALDSFNVIQGKVGLSAEAMRALIMQAGHLFILSEEPGSATVTARRKDWPLEIPNATYTYTLEDASTAQLLGKGGGWQKNPRAMLSARATSGAARAYFADVLAGMSYTPEEIRDFTDEQEVPPSNPPAVPALEDSSATGQPPPPDASSTDSAPATSPEDPPPAPPTASTSDAGSSKSESAPAKKARGSRKAAASSAAPSAPAPAATTLQDALQPPPWDDGTLPSHGSPGEAAVLVQMGLALTELINSLPNAQPALCRAFLQQHFPGRKTADLSESELTLATTIAAGWPQSADQHPIPDAGQMSF